MARSVACGTIRRDVWCEPTACARLENRLPIRDHCQMIIMTLSRHTGVRVAELGFALTAVAGLALLFGAVVPLGRKPGTVVGGAALAVGGILLLIAVHWGRFS